jgi:hypothetical protein
MRELMRAAGASEYPRLARMPPVGWRSHIQTNTRFRLLLPAGWIAASWGGARFATGFTPKGLPRHIF